MTTKSPVKKRGKKAVKRVKAWAIVIGGEIVSYEPLSGSTSLAVYKSKNLAQANTIAHKILPCTIEYTLPSAPKKTTKRQGRTIT